jgi:hypothetical protein
MAIEVMIGPRKPRSTREPETLEGGVLRNLGLDGAPSLRHVVRNAG